MLELPDIAHSGCERGIVRGQHERRLAGVEQPQQNVEKQLRRCTIHLSGWFIQQDEGRLCGHGASDCHPLSLATGKFLGQFLGS